MDTKQEGILTIAGICALIIGIYLLFDLNGLFNNNSEQHSANADIALNEMKKLDYVLNRKIVHDTFQYVGSFESPFRKPGDDLSSRTRNAFANQPPRPKLYLKGILQKNVPLAILEDEKGETYIQGVGENVLDQEILKIADSKVTLRDNRGKYDLTVQEN
jgi:hypothetical protein